MTARYSLDASFNKALRNDRNFKNVQDQFHKGHC